MAFQLSKRDDGGVQVISIRGSVDALSAAELDKTLQISLGTAESKVVVDLTNVEFVSSAGFGSFLAAGRTAKRSGAKLVLCGVHGPTDEAIKVLGIAEFFTMHPDLPSSLSAARQ